MNPADKTRVFFSPGAHLLLCFYGAHLRHGPAGPWESLGCRTQPITHGNTSATPLRLNYSPPLLSPKQLSRKSLTNPSKFLSGKSITPSRRGLRTSFKADPSSLGKLKWERLARQLSSWQTAKFSANEGRYLCRRSWSVRGSIGGDRNFKESLALIQSRSSRPPSFLSLSTLSSPLTRSLDPHSLQPPPPIPLN